MGLAQSDLWSAAAQTALNTANVVKDINERMKGCPSWAINNVIRMFFRDIEDLDSLLDLDLDLIGDSEEDTVSSTICEEAEREKRERLEGLELVTERLARTRE